MNRTRSLDTLITYAVLVLLGVLFLAPLLFMISISLTSTATTMKAAFTLLPREFHIENYVRIFTEQGLGNFFKNSLIIVVFAALGQVLSSSLVAYGFARLRAPGKNLLFIIVLSTLMIPGEVTLIPQFILFRNLKWINTLLPLIVPNFFGHAFNIFMMRQFITRIPYELDEAAKLDGLGPLGIYFRIILPLIKPVLVVIAVFTFNSNWGAFLQPLIFINDVAKMPLALGVQILSATNNAAQMPPWNIVMVGSMLLTIPMVILYFFSQKYMYDLQISGGSAAIK